MANGVDISSTLNNPTSPNGQLQPNEPTSDTVYGELADFGVSASINSTSGAPGTTINFGLVKYMGIQMTLQQNPSLYGNGLLYGVGFGIGAGISLPINVSTP